MNFIILILLLIIGVSVWIVFGITARIKRANKCEYKLCGYYDARNSSNFDDHICRHAKMDIDTFRKNAQDKIPCKNSSEFIGYHPADHHVWSFNKKIENRKLVIAGILTVLIALAPNIINVISQRKHETSKSESSERNIGNRTEVIIGGK